MKKEKKINSKDYSPIHDQEELYKILNFDITLKLLYTKTVMLFVSNDLNSLFSEECDKAGD